MNSINNGTIINNMLDQIDHTASVASDADATMNTAAEASPEFGSREEQENTIITVPPLTQQSSSSSSPRSLSNNDNGVGSGSTGFVAMVRKSITRRLSSRSGSIAIVASSAESEGKGDEQDKQRSKDYPKVEDLRDAGDDDARTVHSDSEDEYEEISLHNNNDDGSGSDGDIEAPAAAAAATYQKRRSNITTENHRKSSRWMSLLLVIIIAVVIAIVVGLVVGLRDDNKNGLSSSPQSSTQDVHTTIDPDAGDPTTTSTTSNTSTHNATTTTTTTSNSKPSIPPLNLNDLTSPSWTSSSSLSSSSSFLRPDKDRLQMLAHGAGSTSTSTEQEDGVEQKEELIANEKEELTALSESCVPINPCDTDPTSSDYSFDEESDHWQCLVGYNASDAEQLILQHYPTKKFTIVILPEFSPITMDLRRDRIRIFTSKQGCVSKAPYIG